MDAVSPDGRDAGADVSRGAALPASPDIVADEPLLRAVDLTRHFRLGGMFGKQVLHAVDDLNLTINEREIVALVGESGSGKSTVARLLARIYSPTKGEIFYRGRPLLRLRRRRDLLWYRGEVAIVFQDPFSAFNPVHRVSHGIMRNLALHRSDLSRSQRRREAARVCEEVGLSPRMLARFPYEMSGGERQRIGFAQALAVRPKLILADEPVSMLDVSIRAGVLNMMVGLRDHEEVSILYITHDLASARYVADRVVVLYAGHLVETGPTETVLSEPKHPYTQLLLSAVADPREQGESISADTGEPPKVINPSEGCRFRWRCPHAIEKCSLITPRPTPIGSVQVACHVAVEQAERAQAAGTASITNS
jgi:peptide/nickel transport system ATP-binding protein